MSFAFRAFKRPLAFVAMTVLAACAATNEPPAALPEVAVAPDEEEAEFVSAGGRFAGSDQCSAYLGELVTRFRGNGYDIAQGPYTVFDGDVRMHAIRAVDGEYVVLEYRCLGNALEARSWRAGPASEDPQPFTIDDIRGMTFPTPDE